MDNHQVEQMIAEAVIEMYQERQTMEALEHLVAKALACHQQGQRCPQEWADQAMSVLRLIQQERENGNV